MTEQRKAVIKNADMSEEMQQDAVDIASQALAKYNIEKVSIVVFLCAQNDLRIELIARSSYGSEDEQHLIRCPSLFHSIVHRMLPPTSKRNLTKNTAPHGT